MPIHRRSAPLAALLVIAVAGCAATGAPPAPTASAPPPAGIPAGASGTPAAGTPAGGSDAGAQSGGGTGAPAGPGGFSATDTAWLQLAIALDERILRVLELVPDRAGEPRVKALAGRLAADHRDVLSRLQELQDRAGAPTTNPHEGHDMPGMATSGQLDALRRATGRTAVDLFATAMRAHLDQSVRLAGAEREHGTEPATRAIAAEMEQARAGQRAQLDQLVPEPGRRRT